MTNSGSRSQVTPRLVLRAGWSAGALTGLGAGGIFGMNLYVAIPLMLGGVFLFVALTVALPREPS